jgi:hypothetical protein
MLGNWPFWFAYVGTGALLVLLAWLGSRRRRLSPKQLAAGGIPAACGSCGYDLTGLPGTTCPECGSDLALVGRISPQFHRWAAVPVTARLIVWTVAVAALGGAFFYVAHESSLPRIQSFRRSGVWYLPVQIPDAPHGRQYHAVSIDLQGQYTRRLWPSNFAFDSLSPVVPSDGVRWYEAQITATFQPPPVGVGEGMQFSTMPTQALVYLQPGADMKPRIIEAGEKRRERPAAGRTGAPDTKRAVVRALEQAGYDGKHGDAGALADALVEEIDQLLESGFLSTQSRAVGPWQAHRNDHVGMVAIRVEPWVMVGASGFWFITWLLGLPFILRKRPLSILRENGAEAGNEVAALKPAGV